MALSGWTLTQVQGEVDRIWVLDAEIHGLALPPGALLVPVEVRQQGGVVAPLRVRRIALVAGARRPRLHAVLLGRRAAHVRRHHGAVEGDVLELGHAATRGPLFIVAGVHGCPDEEVAAEVEGEEKAQERRPPSQGWIHVDSQLFRAQPWVRPKVHRAARKSNQRGRGSPAWEFSLTLSVRAPTYAPTLEWSKFVQEVLSSGADRGGPGVGLGVRPGGQQKFWRTSPPAGHCKHSSHREFRMWRLSMGRGGGDMEHTTHQSLPRRGHLGERWRRWFTNEQRSFQHQVPLILLKGWRSVVSAKQTEADAPRLALLKVGVARKTLLYLTVVYSLSFQDIQRPHAWNISGENGRFSTPLVLQMSVCWLLL